MRTGQGHGREVLGHGREVLGHGREVWGHGREVWGHGREVWGHGRHIWRPYMRANTVRPYTLFISSEHFLRRKPQPVQQQHDSERNDD